MEFMPLILERIPEFKEFYMYIELYPLKINYSNLRFYL